MQRIARQFWSRNMFLLIECLWCVGTWWLSLHWVILIEPDKTVSFLSYIRNVLCKIDWIRLIYNFFFYILLIAYKKSLEKYLKIRDLSLSSTFIYDWLFSLHIMPYTHLQFLLHLVFPSPLPFVYLLPYGSSLCVCRFIKNRKGVHKSTRIALSYGNAVFFKFFSNR